MTPRKCYGIDCENDAGKSGSWNKDTQVKLFCSPKCRKAFGNWLTTRGRQIARAATLDDSEFSDIASLVVALRKDYKEHIRGKDGSGA